jgi:hypothetical protein
MHRLLLAVLVTACASTRPHTLEVVQRVDHADTLAREPMIAENARGTLFVAGYARQDASIWRSRDRGATWQKLDARSELFGNSDVDLAVAPDGALYLVSMQFNRATGEGQRIAVGVTRDEGATWHWTRLDETRFDDRPWIDIAPDGVVHVIWNDGRGVRHTVSRDGGKTWTPMPHVSDKGGSSHLAIGPKNELAVRIGAVSASGNKYDAGTDFIAISTDGGATWQTHAAPGHPWKNEDDRRWVEPLAWDASGALYSLWAEGKTIHLARSTDAATTWTEWPLATMPADPFFPYLVARAHGELAATWFTSDGKTLQWHLASIHVPESGAPSAILSPPLPTTAYALQDPGFKMPLTPDTAGEYVAIAFLHDQTIGAVTPIQTPDGRGFTWWRVAVR